MICAIFLASGRSKRFEGGNKLLYEVEGVPMAEHAFRCIPPDMAGIVVTGWDDVAALAHKHENLAVVYNSEDEDDVAVTIRKGLEALPPEADGAMFFVCDQPWLTRQSVERITDAFRNDPEYIYVLSCGGRSGNPCLFPKAYFPELSSLPYDKGGKVVVRRHPDVVKYIDAARPEELDDVDYRNCAD